MSSIANSSKDNALEQNQVQESVQTGDTSLQNIPGRRKLQQSSKAKTSEKAPSAFRTISEVADELGVQQHVLRFWESKFSYIKPLKRGGGRRYYRPDDVNLLKTIHNLLYVEGYTIKGVQKLLQKTRGNLEAMVETAAHMSAEMMEQDSVVEVDDNSTDKNREKLQSMLDELKSMRDMINK